MAIVGAVGKSKAPEGLAAGQQAAQACLRGLSGPPGLILVFCSSHYHPEQVLSGIRTVFPGVPLMGCTSAGEISLDGPDDQSVVVSALSGLQARVERGGDIREDSFQAGRQLGQALAGPEAKTVLMLSDGLAGDGGALVRGLNAGLGRHLPITGGAASDDLLFEKTSQFFNDAILSQTLVGAALEGDFVFGVGVRHGWEPVGLPVKVTQSSGHMLFALNGCPAVRFYEEYFGEYFDRLRNEPLGRLAVLYPLGMAVPDSTEYLLRAPFSVEPDGAIHYAADLPEGAEVRLMIGSVAGAVQAARIAAMEALSQMQGRMPQLALIFNCVSRRKVFGPRAGDEIDTIRDIIGPQVPVAGFYTYGEIAPVEGLKENPAFFHNETVVIVLIG